MSSSGVPVYGPAMNSYMTMTAGDVVNGFPTSLVEREPDGTARAFEAFESTAVLRLAELVDRNGNTVHYDRDGQARLSRVTDIHGRYFALTYNAEGFVASLSDSAGRTRTYTYDSEGHRLSETTPQGTSAYEYDSQNRITRITYPNNSVKNYVYDSQNRVVSEDDGEGRNRLTYVYGSSRTIITDALGRPTVYDYLVKGGLKKVVKMTDPAGGVTSYAYDSNLNLVSQTDPLGRITRYAYDDKGNVTATQDAAGGRTLTSYDPVYSQPAYVLDPLSRRTDFNYDAMGNQTQVIDALLHATNKGYDQYGHMTRHQDPLGNETEYTYTASNGAMSSMTDPLKRVTAMQTDALSRVVKNTDPLGRATQYVYDTAGNLIESIDAAGQVTHYTYSPGRTGMLMATVQDALGHVTSFGFDDLGRRTSMTNALTQSKSSVYDAKGNLVQSVNARGQAISYSYDSMDRLLTKTMPEGPVSYTYDGAGNLLRVANHNGSVVEQSFDSMNRLTQSRQTLPNGHTAVIGYSYDAAGNRTGMSTPWENFSYQYDNLNRVTSITNPQGKAFGYSYDAGGRKTSLSYPNGIVASFGYDAAGQLLSLTHTRTADGVVIASAAYVYDKAGNRTSMVDGSGLHSYGYDVLYRLTSAAHPEAAGLAAETFAYDAEGNRLSDGKISGYQYDAANRLLENSSYTYTYDADGNQTGRTVKATDAAMTLAYDSENRLKQATLADGTVWTYKYDGQGRRVEKSSGTAASQIVRYVYDRDNIVAILDGANGLLALYTNGLGIDEPLMMRRTDGTEYGIHGDPLNSVIAHSDSSGTLVELVRYEAYGKPIYWDTRAAPVAAAESFTGNPLAFTGRIWDGATRLYDYRNRQTYDPETGRWGQEDPIGLTSSLHTEESNLFVYVINNPLRHRDPSGLDPIVDLGDGCKLDMADFRECLLKKAVPPFTFMESLLLWANAAALISKPIFVCVALIDLSVLEIEAEACIQEKKKCAQQPIKSPVKPKK